MRLEHSMATGAICGATRSRSYRSVGSHCVGRRHPVHFHTVCKTFGSSVAPSDFNGLPFPKDRTETLFRQTRPPQQAPDRGNPADLAELYMPALVQESPKTGPPLDHPELPGGSRLKAPSGGLNSPAARTMAAAAQ